MTSATQEWVPFGQTFEKGFKFPDVSVKNSSVSKPNQIPDQSAQNTPYFRTKWSKWLYPISDQNGPKPYPLGRHIPILYILYSLYGR